MEKIGKKKLLEIISDLKLEKQVGFREDLFKNGMIHHLLNKNLITKEILDLLIERGYNLNDRNIDQEIPLHLASSIENIDQQVLLKLIDLSSEKDLNVKDLNEGNNALLNYCKKIKNPKMEIIDFFIQKKSEMNLENINNSNLFHFICKNRNINPNLIKYLIEKKMDLNSKNKFNKSPFHFAIQNENITTEILELMVNNGATIDSNKEALFLFLSLENKNKTAEILKFFAREEWKINFQIKKRNFSLLENLLRTKNLKYESVELLIEKKVKEISNLDKLLDSISVNENLDLKIIKLIFKDMNENQFKREFLQKFFVHHSSLEKLKYFVEEKKIKIDNQILESAVSNKKPNIEIIKYLIEMKMIPKIEELELAARNENIDFELFEILSKFHQDFTSKTNELNLLHQLCKREKNISFDLVKFFIDKKLKLERNNLMRYPFQKLAQKKNLDFRVIKLLIENNSDINSEDIFSISSFKYLCLNYDIKHLNFLCQKKAGLGTIRGQSPLYFLSKNKTVPFEKLKFLIEKKSQIDSNVDYYNCIFALCQGSINKSKLDYYLENSKKNISPGLLKLCLSALSLNADAPIDVIKFFFEKSNLYDPKLLGHHQNVQQALFYHDFDSLQFFTNTLDKQGWISFQNFAFFAISQNQKFDLRLFFYFLLYNCNIFDKSYGVFIFINNFIIFFYFIIFFLIFFFLFSY